MHSNIFVNSSVDENFLMSTEVIEEYEKADVKKVQIEVGNKLLLISNDPSVFHNDYDYDTNVFNDIDISVFMRLASIRAESDRSLQYLNERLQHDVWKAKVRTHIREELEKPTVRNIKEKMESLYAESLNEFKKRTIDYEMDYQNLKYLIYQFGNKLRHLLYVLQTNKYLYE